MINLQSQSDRVKLINDINSYENEQRKNESLQQCEVYSGRIYPYVLKYLRSKFSTNTVNEMPIVSSLNLARRVCKQEASIYKRSPKRTFYNVNDNQIKTLNRIYDDMMADSMLLKSSVYYKLQSQNCIQVLPKNKKLSLRVLKQHQYDVIPNKEDPELAEVYIISSYDKYLETNTALEDNGLNQSSVNHSDMINQKIGDKDDYKAELERYLVWSKDFNFIMDGNGEIISESDENIISDLPFIDVANEKDFEYFVRSSSQLTDFTITYNAAMSCQNQVVQLQGFAVAYLKGPADMLPIQNIQIGPNYILKLAIDPNNPVPTEFGYVSPNADLQGSREHLEGLLSSFLTSYGVEPSTVSGKAQAKTFSSGIERLLSNLEKFEASREDYDTYRFVEDRLFDLIRKWHNALINSDLLDDKYKTALIPDNAYVVVEFAGPEMVTSEAEKLDLITRKLDAGLMSRKDAIIEMYNIDEKEAEEKIEEIDQVLVPKESAISETLEQGSENDEDIEQDND